MPSVPKSVGVQQQFNKIPVLGLVVEQAGSAPGSAVNGQVYYDTSLEKFQFRENGAWVAPAILDGSSKVPIANIPTGSSGTTVALGNHGHALTDANITGVLPIAQVPTGQTGTTVPLGNDARFTDSRAPSGAATGGDLAGTYPSPTIALLAVTDAKVAAANKDGVAGTVSMRTLGYTGNAAMPGIARLDQIGAPTAAVGFNGQRLTSVATPTSGTDAANRDYVDGVAAGLDPKGSVRAASSANVVVTYSATGGTSGRGQITAAPNTLDGVTLAAGNRILLKDQTTGAQNGIYVVTTLGSGANGVWDRAADFDTDGEVTSGAFVFVEQGTANDNTGWLLGTNNPIVIGGGSGTALVWVQFTGGAALTAGAGMTQTGNTFDVIGTAARITVNADSIDIAATYVGQTSITTLGTITTGVWSGTTIALNKGGTGATDAAGARTNLGATGKYAANLAALVAGTELIVTHNLGTKDVKVAIYRVADDYEEILAVRAASTNTVGVTADLAYAGAALRIVVVG